MEKSILSKEPENIRPYESFRNSTLSFAPAMGRFSSVRPSIIYPNLFNMKNLIRHGATYAFDSAENATPVMMGEFDLCPLKHAIELNGIEILVDTIRNIQYNYSVMALETGFQDFDPFVEHNLLTLRGLADSFEEVLRRYMTRESSEESAVSEQKITVHDEAKRK